LEAAEHHVSTSQQQDWEAAQSQTSATTSNSSSTQQLLQDLPCSQLLCTVRALLKKMNQRVLAGDRVRVNNIDWNEGRAVVESIGPRSSELADPAVANVNHVLLLFGLTQPPVRAAVTRLLKTCY
jgi:putative ribosome biogenesis GTPase RsgA